MEGNIFEILKNFWTRLLIFLLSQTENFTWQMNLTLKLLIKQFCSEAII